MVFVLFVACLGKSVSVSEGAGRTEKASTSTTYSIYISPCMAFQGYGRLGKEGGAGGCGREE